MSNAIRLEDSLFTITVNLTGVPAPRATFGIPLLVGPLVTPPGTDLTRTYAAASAATTLASDVTAKYIDQHISDYVTSMFSQTPRPSTIKVGKIAYLTAAADLSAIVAQDNDWYGLCMDLDGEAIADKETYITAVAAWVEAREKVGVFDSDDPGIYAVTTTDIAAMEAALAHERTAILYSQLDPLTAKLDQPAAPDALARWLAFDPDVISAPFRAQVRDVIAATVTAVPPADPVDLTAAQIAFIKGKNASCLQPYGSAAAFLDPGTNAAGRQFHEILTKDWLTARIREDMADLVVALANRGRKWPLNNEGVALACGVVSKWLAVGVQAAHFSDFTTPTGSYSTTTSKISVSATATVLGNAREFTFLIDFV